MSSQRVSKRRDSRQLYVSAREKKDQRSHSHNDLMTLHDPGSAPVPPVAAAAAPPVNGTTPTVIVVGGGGGGGGRGRAEFGSSLSVQTVGGGSQAGSSDANSIASDINGGDAGRGRAESLELGQQARGSFVRSSLLGRDLHPNGLHHSSSGGGGGSGRHRDSSGSVDAFSGSSVMLSSSSHNRQESFYLTVNTGRSRHREALLRAASVQQDPEQHAKRLQRYRELQELLKELKDKKQASEAELQRLLVKERELTSKPTTGASTKKCLPTQFLVAIQAEPAESDAESALSAELDTVKQEIAVQRAVVEAHIRLLRDAKAAKQPRPVRKQRAAEYQQAMEKLSYLNLRAREIRDRMSNAELYDDDTISQASSFAFHNCDADSLAGSSAYHNSPRNTPAGYYPESLLSGQMYDARSMSDLSRNSSIRSAVSAYASSVSGSIQLSHASAPQPSTRRPLDHVTSAASDASYASAPVRSTQQQEQQQQQQPPQVVARRSGLAPNARSGSNWRRSNSMGNLLADQPQYQPQPQPQPQAQPRQHASRAAPVNTSFPAELPPSQPLNYRRTSGQDRALSYRYQPRSQLESAAPQPQAPQLTASHQSPYWYTPPTRLEPAAAPVAAPRHRKQQSDL